MVMLGDLAAGGDLDGAHPHTVARKANGGFHGLGRQLGQQVDRQAGMLGRTRHLR